MSPQTIYLTPLLLVLNIPIIRCNSIYDNGKRPHIVFIMADDMGWNDVSFHGSNQVPTPNIDALAYDGIILNRHYTAPMCTPSRAALMTGKNPISIGMQHYVIVNDQPFGLGLDQKIMPQYFKDAGYRTHMIGKWHLGFFARQYTPTMRGFDTHIGYYNGYIDYWNYTAAMTSKEFTGYDMRHNLEVDRTNTGTYATDMFTDAATRIISEHNPNEPLFLLVSHLAPHSGNDDEPLQAPEDRIKRFNYVTDENRRTYAAMVSKLDDSVGQIFKSLRAKDMLENSIIVFISDNGAPTNGMHSNSGSNYPFRGQKNSPWEGSTRNIAAIWSPLLEERQRVSNQYMHISDWLPTLASIAGIRLPRSDNHSEIDGIDQWEALSYDTGNPRRAVLNVIDEIFGFSSYMENGYKYVNGTTSNGLYDGWYGQVDTTDRLQSDEEYIKSVLATEIALYSGDNLTGDLIKHLRKHARVSCGKPLEPTKCKPLLRGCLFDIVNDPCELNDLSHKEYEKFRNFRATVDKYRRLAKKPRNKPSDVLSNPSRFGNVWNWWRADISKETILALKKEDEAADSREGLEIPPPHSSLPEDIRLTVIITIVVVGILFVSGALVYMSNKNLLRICRCSRSSKKEQQSKMGTNSIGAGSADLPTNLGHIATDSSSDEKLSDVFGEPSSSNRKVYHISDNRFNRY